MSLKETNTNFQQICLGPYQIHEKIRAGNFKLKIMEGETKELLVNGQILKRYLS